MFAGATVAARVFGAGPKLVLLHSLLADRSSFDRVTGALSEHFTVMLPALPGFAGSAAVGGDLTAVADRMVEAVREFSNGEQMRLLGNGYGGFVALQMALRHPDLASRLVLADAGAAFSEPGREAFRGMARGAATRGLEAIADIAMRRLFAPDFHGANPELVAERRAIFLATDPAAVIAACGALAELDLRPALPGLVAPILALVGEQDEATPPAMSRELAALAPNASLVVLEGCAHVPQLQAPEQFLTAIVPFLT
jgi:3-oxoadipate enol-lactonase